MRAITLTSAALLLATGCSGGSVVNTDERATFPTAATPVAPQLPPTDSGHLANAFDFVGYEQTPLTGLQTSRRAARAEYAPIAV